MDWFKGKRTYIVCGLGIVTAVALTGLSDGDWSLAFKEILIALGGIGMRLGVADLG